MRADHPPKDFTRKSMLPNSFIKISKDRSKATKTRGAKACPKPAETSVSRTKERGANEDSPGLTSTKKPLSTSKGANEPTNRKAFSRMMSLPKLQRSFSNSVMMGTGPLNDNEKLPLEHFSPNHLEENVWLNQGSDGERRLEEFIQRARVIAEFQKNSLTPMKRKATLASKPSAILDSPVSRMEPPRAMHGLGNVIRMSSTPELFRDNPLKDRSAKRIRFQDTNANKSEKSIKQANILRHQSSFDSPHSMKITNSVSPQRKVINLQRVASKDNSSVAAIKHRNTKGSIVPKSLSKLSPGSVQKTKPIVRSRAGFAQMRTYVGKTSDLWADIVDDRQQQRADVSASSESDNGIIGLTLAQQPNEGVDLQSDEFKQLCRTLSHLLNYCSETDVYWNTLLIKFEEVEGKETSLEALFADYQTPGHRFTGKEIAKAFDARAVAREFNGKRLELKIDNPRAFLGKLTTLKDLLIRLILDRKEAVRMHQTQQIEASFDKLRKLKFDLKTRKTNFSKSPPRLPVIEFDAVFLRDELQKHVNTRVSPALLFQQKEKNAVNKSTGKLIMNGESLNQNVEVYRLFRGLMKVAENGMVGD